MYPPTPDVSDSPGPSRPAAASLLALLRVYLGIVFLVAVVPKLTSGVPFAARMSGFLENVALGSAHGFYRAFLESVVLPRADVFAGLVVAGEVVAGVGLVTGTATRLAGSVAALLALNYLFAKGAWFWTPSSNDAAFFVIALAVVLGAAGRTLGVDRLLVSRYPRWPLG